MNRNEKEILAIIEELNYTQNVNAIHLVKGKTNVIGVLLPHVNDQYYSAIIEGISKETAKNNYNMMLCQTNYSEERELEILNMLKNEKSLMGLLFVLGQIVRRSLKNIRNSARLLCVKK